MIYSEGSDASLSGASTALAELLPDATLRAVPGEQHTPDVDALIGVLREFGTSN